jgi:hypothetical protein
MSYEFFQIYSQSKALFRGCARDADFTQLQVSKKGSVNTTDESLILLFS